MKTFSNLEKNNCEKMLWILCMYSPFMYPIVTWWRSLPSGIVSACRDRIIWVVRSIQSIKAFYLPKNFYRGVDPSVPVEDVMTIAPKVHFKNHVIGPP
jgi:hypothetical protein